MGKKPTSSNSQEAIAARLRQARARFYSTPEEAADALRVGKEMYRQHESGERGLRSMAIVYARAFSVPLRWLRAGLGPMERTVTAEIETKSHLPQLSPQPIARDTIGPESLLFAMGVVRNDRRVFVASDPHSAPARLPLLRESDGYVVELAAAHPDDNFSRKINVWGDEAIGRDLLVVRGISRIDPESLRTNRAFIARLQRNELTDHSRGQRVVVDPDDTSFEFDEDGLFVFNVRARFILFFVSCNQKTDGEGDPVYFVWHTKEKPGRQISKEEFSRKVVGRVIGLFAYCGFTQKEVRDLLATCQPPPSENSAS